MFNVLKCFSVFFGVIWMLAGCGAHQSTEKGPRTESVQTIHTEGVTLVYFSAEWCPPCHVQGPVVDEVKKRMGDRATVQKVDVDKSPALSNQFGIRGMPTLIVLKDGKEVRRLEGLHRDADELVRYLESELEAPATNVSSGQSRA